MDGTLIGWFVAMGIFWILILWGALVDPGGEEDDWKVSHQQDTDLQGEVRQMPKMDARQRRGARRRAKRDEGERVEGHS